MKARYVYESIQFQRGGDPKHSIGVGRAAIYKDVDEDIKEILVNRILAGIVPKHYISVSTHQFKPQTGENVLKVDLYTEDWDNEKLYAMKKSLDSEMRFEKDYLERYLRDVWEMTLTKVIVKIPISVNRVFGRDIVRRRGLDRNSYISIYYKK